MEEANAIVTRINAKELEIRSYGFLEDASIAPSWLL
jgi:hypothetical protein